jgi:hypothetical protein
VSRFPVGDSVTIRLDAALPLDSIARDPESEAPAGGRLDAALFLLDERYERAAQLTRSLPVQSDTIPVSLELTVPAGDYVYSLEALQPESRLAGRSAGCVRESGSEASPNARATRMSEMIGEPGSGPTSSTG